MRGEGGGDGSQEKGIGRKRGGAATKHDARDETSIDARGLAKRLACWFPRGRGAKDPTRGARDAARGRGSAARGPSRGEGGGRGRGGLGTVACGGSFRGGAWRRRRDANYIHQSAPFWMKACETLEKLKLQPRAARGPGRASRARRDARGRTSGWAFARTTVDAARATAAREGGARGHADAAAHEARASARGVARRCRDGRDAGDGGDRLARHGSTV